ncbi:MAG: hypothetical protein ACTHNP_12710 [Solirubrobacterales bacterium]
MSSFYVRFKGLLFKAHFERMSMAGIEFRSSEPGMQIGPIKTGEPINTVVVEAASEEAAVQAVRRALVPDDVNFTAWEAGAV